MIKGLFDFILAAFGLVVVSPVFVAVACLIKLESAGPIFFRQERVGIHFQPFLIYKFRTMKVNTSIITLELVTPGDPRITRVGKVLRKTKMDEFPQLINILKGEMSFVGPRPELRELVEHYREDFAKILEVKPGITDTASLKYKDEEEMHDHSGDAKEYYITHIMPEKIKLWKEYVYHSSMLLDIKIIGQTLVKLFR